MANIADLPANGWMVVLSGRWSNVLRVCLRADKKAARGWCPGGVVSPYVAGGLRRRLGPAGLAVLLVGRAEEGNRRPARDRVRAIGTHARPRCEGHSHGFGCGGCVHRVGRSFAG